MTVSRTERVLSIMGTLTLIQEVVYLEQRVMFKAKGSRNYELRLVSP